MKRIITICCFVLYCLASRADADTQQQFEKANALFSQKQYSDAANAYQQLINEGYHRPELYVNAGNAWYKANRTGMAIYNYEKALAQDPYNKSALHNLAVANQRVEGFVDDLPLLFFQKWWIQLQHLHHPNGWAIGSILLCWLLAGLILVRLFKPGFRPGILRGAIGVTGVLFLFYLGMGISAVAGASSHDTGIVMSNTVKVKAAPDMDSKDVFELHEGMKVQVTDATREFCKIALPDGKTGWLACAEVRRL